MHERVMRMIAAGLMAAGLAGCAQPAHTDKPMTERQRDSVIATEKALPGSDVVGRALATSDSAAAQAKRMDEQAAGDQSGEGK